MRSEGVATVASAVVPSSLCDGRRDDAFREF